MRVLITNDDGIESPWLSDLAGAFEGDGHHVTVIAPADNCSGMSGALAPLMLGGETEIGLRRRRDLPGDSAWGAEGCSPSVCVMVGLGGFVEGPVDLVVSGINYGWNVGRDIWRSGTVWAAMTAWGVGVPALAVSAAPTSYSHGERREVGNRTARVAKELVEAPVPEIWNLNFPDPPSSGWGEPLWVPTAAHERLTDAAVSVVRRPEDGDAVVRLNQEHGSQVQGTEGTDAEVVLRGGVTLSRLRAVEAVAEEPPSG
jgi:5'-nucleotidase